MNSLKHLLCTGAMLFAVVGVANAQTGALSGTADTPVSSINLTTEGGVDWIKYNGGNSDPVSGTPLSAHKTPVATGVPVNLISDYSLVGSFSVGGYGDNPTGFSWTDGDNPAAQTNIHNGIYGSIFDGSGNNVVSNAGYSVTVPADKAVRTFRIYVGGYNLTGTMTASLSDGSAPTYTNSASSPVGQSFNVVYTFVYHAKTDGQTLTVSWLDTTQLGAYSNPTIQAATLNTGTVAKPGIPTGVTAVASPGKIKVSWNAVGGADHYNVKRSTTSGGTYTTIATTATDLTIDDLSVVSGTQYFYEVSAFNSFGESANSAPASAAAQANYAFNPVLVSSGKGEATISFNTVPGVTTYSLKRSTAAAGPFSNVAGFTSPSGSSVTYLDVVGGDGTVKYYYTVTTKNVYTESPVIGVVSVMPQSALAFDTASDPTYQANGFADTTNGGFGFGPWSLVTDTTAGGYGGTFEYTSKEAGDGTGPGIDTPRSDYPVAFGIYAGQGGIETVTRPFTTPLAVGQTFGVAFNNGYIDGTGSDGIKLTDATGAVRFGFFFTAGTGTYQLTDASGTIVTPSLNFTSGGMYLAFTLNDATHYTFTASLLAPNVTQTFTGTLAAGDAISQFIGYNNSAGGGSNHNLYLNSLAVAAPIGSMVSGTVAIDSVPDLSAVNPLVPVGSLMLDFFAANSATHNTPLFSKTAAVFPVGGGSPNGTFSVTGVMPGSYDIGISFSKTLRAIVKNVNATSNAVIPGTTTLLSGNANGDKTVNFDDFLVLLNSFGSTVADPMSGFDPTADFDYNGIVNFDDFLALLNNFGAVSDI